MKIEYLTTDFECESTENLNALAHELGDALAIQLNQWVDGVYSVSLSGTSSELFDQPEKTIHQFCDLVESLSENSRKLWQGCIKRVADIGFKSGNEPGHVTYQLPADLIRRLETLKIGIAVTIYSR